MNLFESLRQQERWRDAFWEKSDPFILRRLDVQARMVRHLFHLLPGESILELAAGSGLWTDSLLAVTKGNNPICSVTFDPDISRPTPKAHEDAVQIIRANDFPAKRLEDRSFDYVVGWHSLNNETFGPFMMEVRRLLKPGGHFLFFDSNPWNPLYVSSRCLTRLFGLKDRVREHFSLNRLDLHQFLSETGFIRVILFPHDFLYPIIPKFLVSNIDAANPVLENTPVVRNFARTIAILGQKPAPDDWRRPTCDLVEHDALRDKVSVVIPCHNEADNLPALIAGLTGFYGGYLHEILVIDDNSQDDTVAVAEALEATHPIIRVVKRSPPNGVGLALRDGIAEAQGEYTLLMDGDFQLLLPELTGLFDAIADGADVAIGSRFSPGSVLINYPFMKILANRFFHWVARIIFRKKFRDVTNNLKLMKTEIAKDLELESTDFAANAETGLKPILRGHDVREAPISWINRSVDMGVSNFSLSKSGPNYWSLLWRLAVKKR